MSEGDSLHCRFDGFELDEANARLSRGAREIPLPPRALAVLCTLARHPDRLITKNDLLDAVWGHRHVSESVLKSAISQIRAALGDDAREPRYIQTASRHGYRFVADVDSSDARIDQPSRPESVLCSPVAPASIDLSRVAGRTDAMLRLESAWKRACDGQRQFVLVAGEAGIGKTSLVDAFLGSRRAGRFARGQCIEAYGMNEACLPILDALGEWCRQDVALPALLRRIAPTWLLQMPWLHESGEDIALRTALAGASPQRMMRELGELLDRYSEPDPLLLVLEDLHWSDASTVAVLDHLCRRRSPCRLLVIGTYRSVEAVVSDHPLRTARRELRAHALCEEIVLEPLTEQDLADFLSWRLPGMRPCEAWISTLHAHTDGIPLFFVHVVDDLVSRDAVSDCSRSAATLAGHLREAVPESLFGFVERQLDRLPADTRKLLSIASACGVVFREGILAEVLGLDADMLAQQLAQLNASGTWIEHEGTRRLSDGSLDTRHVFRHALYRQVVYQTINERQRIDWHNRIGRALLAADARDPGTLPAELAMHFERGKDFQEAARQLEFAAQHAITHFAPIEACAHARRGIEMLDACVDDKASRDRRFSLLVLLGVAAAQVHGVASVETIEALQEARRIGEPHVRRDQRNWLLNGIGWAHFSRGEFEKSGEQARRILEEARSVGGPALELCGGNLLGATLCYSADLEEADRVLEVSLQQALACGDRIPRGHTIVDLETSVRVYLSQTRLARGLTEAACSQAESAFLRAQALGHPMSLALSLRNLCRLGIRIDDVDRVEYASRILGDLVRQHGLAQSLGPSRWYAGWVLARTGRIEEGLELVLEGYRGHTATGMRAGCSLALGHAAQILALKSDGSSAESRLRDAIDLAGTLGESLDTSHLMLLLAQHQRDRDDTPGACATAGRALALARSIHAGADEVLALTRLAQWQPNDSSLVPTLQSLIEAQPRGFDERLRADACAQLRRSGAPTGMPAKVTPAR